MKISCIQAQKEHHPFLLPSWAAQQRSGTWNRTFLLRFDPKWRFLTSRLRTKNEIRYDFSRISHWTKFEPKRTKRQIEKTNRKNVFLSFENKKNMFETNLIIQKIKWLSDRLDFWQLWFRLAHIKSSVTIFGKPYQGSKLKKNQNETCWLSRW